MLTSNLIAIQAVTPKNHLFAVHASAADAAPAPVLPETASIDEVIAIAAASLALLNDPEASPEAIAMTRGIVARLENNPIFHSAFI